MKKFDQLGLNPQLLATVEEQGYSSPTPIQEASIPTILEGKDLFATAPTGTGKTAAFAIPLIQKMSDKPQKKVSTLILAPTRELAHQISDNFKKYASNSKLRITLIYGGVSQHRQVESLRRGCQVIIATPGRLLDLMQQGHVHLDGVKHFVLDECDRMLDMGFIGDIRKIGEHISDTQKQTLLFSATASQEIRTLSEELLNEPERIDIVPSEEHKPKIEQWLMAVSQKNKTELLVEILEDEEIDSAIIFTRTKYGADKLVKTIRAAGHTACAIHGNKTQRERTNNLESFKRGRDRVLVATDVAARGMDIPALNYVVNFDMAEDPETHTHRIGRTGRAGRTGLAISFCSEGEYKHLKALHKLHGKDCMIEMEHDFRIELASNNKREGSKKKGGKNSNRNRNNRRRNERRSGENRSKKRSESFA